MKFTVAIFSLCFVLVAAEVLKPFSLGKHLGGVDTRNYYTGALMPRYEAELLYPQDTASDSLSFKFVVSHRDTPYVLIENFQHSLNNVTCSPKAGQALLRLYFSDALMVEKAKEYWHTHKRILFVTRHNGCNGPHEHGFFRSSSVEYDLVSHSVLIKALQVQLGESGHASSLIRITGGLPTPELRRQKRRQGIPADSKISKREDKVSSTSLNLAQKFNPREVMFSTTSGMTLTCVDCSMEGQFNLVFNLSINTDLASSLLSSAASEVSSGISVVTSDVASVASVVTSGVESVITAAPNAISSVGSQIGSGITSLFGGLRFRRDIPSPQNFLQQVVQEMSVALVQVNPIKANFNFEFASGDQVISLPLFALPPDIPLSGITPGPLFSGIPLAPISLGPFQLQFTPKPLALSLAANIAPNVNVTFPVLASASISQPLKLNLFAPPEGAIDPPSIQVQPPIVNSIDTKLSIDFTIGPSLVAKLIHTPTNTDLEIRAGLDLPKIDVTFSEQTNVDQTCAPNGPIQKALGINTTLALGLELSSKANIFGVSLGDIIKRQIPDLSSLGLLHTFDLDDTCIDLNSIKIGGGAQPLPVSATSVSGTVTAAMDMSSFAAAVSTIAASTTCTEVDSSTTIAASNAGFTNTIVINLPGGIPSIALDGAAAAGSIAEMFTGTATALLSEATDFVAIEVSINEG